MISAVALMASFASCNKIEQGNNTPVVTPAVDGTTAFTISAAVPQTKTYIKDNVVRWSANDVIAILAEKCDPVRSERIENSAEKHDFTINGWYEGVTPQYAAFTGPYTSDDNYNPYKPVWNEDGTIQMTVRSNQPIYNQGSFSKIANISIGELNEVEGGNYTAELKNVCGLIKFTLTKPTISVEIANADPEGQPMAGKVNVAMENGVPRATFVPETGGNVKITSSIGESKIEDSDNLLAHNMAHTYYAVVIPGTYTPMIKITPYKGEPIILTAKSSVTINRNEYVDFGEIDNVETPGTGEGGDEPVTPPSPTKTLTLTVDFSAWPFQEAVVNSKTTTAAEGNEYTFVHDGENYKFTIINTVIDGSCKGFYWRSATQGIQGNDSIGKGVTGDFEVKFPVVKDMKLTSVAVSVANGEDNKKFVKILNAGGGTVVSDNVHNENSPKVFEIPEPVVSSSYSLTSGGKNIQLLGLILTYTN